MPIFGSYSKEKLMFVDDRLRRVMDEAIKYWDFRVVSGYRDEEEQNRLADEGLSQVRYPESKHNTYPSLAVDIAPYPIDWKDQERFVLFAGGILTVARQLGIPLRWGGDWNMDDRVADTSFRDFGHFELVERG